MYFFPCLPDSCERRSSRQQFYRDTVRHHHSRPSGPQSPPQQMQQTGHPAGQCKDGGNGGGRDGWLYERMNKWKEGGNGRMNGPRKGRMDKQINERIDGPMNQWKDGWTG